MLLTYRPAPTLLAALLISSRAGAGLALVEQPEPGDFLLSAGGAATSILVETNADLAVKRAAGDLEEDIFRVGGVRPGRLDRAGAEKALILVGTLGQSPILDKLSVEGRLDDSGVKGKWESYLLQVVTNPTPGVERALVVAGSDRRGTIYGAYEISERIGVSPWHWWADVPVKRKPALAFRGESFKQGPPAVKYRGVFLNDEDWGLRPWAAKTFEPEAGNIGPKTYARVFELLLRLRANYLWPAMHPGTPAFNANPVNKTNADLYGIVMGSSHCEQMLRDNVDEWDTNRHGAYNYVINRDGVLQYWEERVRENGRFENVYTLGMRGVHDGRMPGGGAAAEQARRLHRIIADQRELLGRLVNTNVAAVPQIFCPYKEALELYRLAPDIPEDITLVWPDDNYGYVRGFSSPRERRRGGGGGVYYHLSYWGAPNDYLWLCSTPPALIAEEMVKAYEYGADRVWMVNVGDLKPAELGLEFFLKLGWNPRAWNPTNSDLGLEPGLARDFGSAAAREIGPILAEYYRLNFQRKPEHLGFSGQGAFSPFLDGDEVQGRLDAWRALAGRVERAGKAVAPEARDAFFELVEYPVRGAALMNEKWLALTRFYAYRKQGRAGADLWLGKAHQAQAEIERETERYNNEIAGGKWRGMMSAHPRDQAVFGFPQAEVIAGLPSGRALGLAVEGRAEAVFAGATNSAGSLPRFSRLTRRSYFVDVFNGAGGPLPWQAKPADDWVKLDRSSGAEDARVSVSIDWDHAPKGDAVGSIIQFSAADKTLGLAVSVFNPGDVRSMEGADFVEDNQRVIIEAGRASKLVPGKQAQWEVVRGLGYGGQAVTVWPVTAPACDEPDRIQTEAPCLEYSIWFEHAGDWTVTVRALPTFSIDSSRPERYAIALDDRPPKVVSLPRFSRETDRQWQENVLRNAVLTSSAHRVEKSGVHRLRIWMVTPGLVLDAIAAQQAGSLPLGYVWTARL